MNKKYLTLLLALTSFSSQSNTADSYRSDIPQSFRGALHELRNTPVTQFDWGVAKLKVLIENKNKEFKNDDIGKTKFKFQSAILISGGSEIGIHVYASGNQDDVTERTCKAVTVLLQRKFTFFRLPYQIWSDLSPQTYRDLQSELKFDVSLENENGEGFKSCKFDL